MKRRIPNTLLLAVLVFSIVFSLFGRSHASAGGGFSSAGINTTYAPVALETMTPEEKVGQLFLVSFQGRDTGEDSQIRDLIFNYHVGGVILRRSNDNFRGPDNTLAEAQSLINNLQLIASQKSYPSVGSETIPHPYIPLFIGISQEGDLSPNDQILTGLTALPNAMAIGATWDPQLAEKVGEVLGSELQSLGVNLLLGPSLDVLDVVYTEGGDDLGTRTFGGDPYWVAEMGQAYIQGLHAGSGNRLAVIAKHFPGRGGSDRMPEDEVATVRKSLEQLKQIELAPFFAVTNGSLDSASQADGLLVSHIRYQGFQGNIRATTRPVSFDQVALDQLMSLDEFSSWRAQDGLVVSDNLGSAAVRKFFDPTNTYFDARQVARSAFLAGNDLLVLDNFITTGDPDSYTTIIKTLEFFTQKYEEDSLFAQRVDASVARILALKSRLYPSFEINKVVASPAGVESIGKGSQVTFAVANKAVTLISPDQEELDYLLPSPPLQTDRIVFLTDTYAMQQCTKCEYVDELAVDSLQNAVLRLYGPQGGGQVQTHRLLSYSFTNLKSLLDQSLEYKAIEADIRYADWIVISLLGSSHTPDSLETLKRFLSERSDLMRNKKIIVFALNAPYYLDSTDISKLTAYYAVYSKVNLFLEVAARVLFQEMQPAGSVPVSVPGIGYDLIVATSPDPGQVIPLYMEKTAAEPTPGLEPVTTSTEAAPTLTFNIGESIHFRTGVIVDHNGKHVPDGTVVRFLVTTNVDTGAIQQVETTTFNGVAHGSYRIQNTGRLEIRVVSDPATVSQILSLEITEGGGGIVRSFQPTPEPAETSTPEVYPSLAPTDPATPAHGRTDATPNVGDWLLAVIIAWAAGAGVFSLVFHWESARWGTRWGLLVIIGGLMGYLYLAASLPGSETWMLNLGLGAVVLASLAGILFGALCGGIWFLVGRNREKKTSPSEGEINAPM